MHKSQICHIKRLAQILFDLLNQMGCTTSNDQVINVDDKKKDFTTNILDKQVGIQRTPLKALTNQILIKHLIVVECNILLEVLLRFSLSFLLEGLAFAFVLI